MLKNLLADIALYKKAIFFLSILPTVSILLGFYAQNFAFKETAEPFNFQSPISRRIVGTPEIQGVSSQSADKTDDNELQSFATPTAKPRKEAGTAINVTPPLTPKEEPKAVTVTAKSNRINFPYNKFGVYIFDTESDIDLAAQLVNSGGGDWGWILVPILMTERNDQKWNTLFAQMADKHLIPVLQLSLNNGQVPSDGQIDEMAKFLGGLGWPIKLRFITVFNEVNASEYWGGKIDPEGYARVLSHVIDSFKSQNQEFFIMNGAFNASARTGSLSEDCITTDLGVRSCYLSEIAYLRRMNAAVPGIFNKLDGWAAHTYPFPGYRGTPSDTRVSGESDYEAGRNTIRSYQFELRILRDDFGLSLPVFITETGWPHKEGNANPDTSKNWYDQNTVAEFYRQAFANIFLPDPRVVAVMPFILRTDSPSNFAFISSNGEKFPQWNTITSFAKTTGAPPVNR